MRTMGITILSSGMVPLPDFPGRPRSTTIHGGIEMISDVNLTNPGLVKNPIFSKEPTAEAAAGGTTKVDADTIALGSGAGPDENIVIQSPYTVETSPAADETPSLSHMDPAAQVEEKKSRLSILEAVAGLSLVAGALMQPSNSSAFFKTMYQPQVVHTLNQAGTAVQQQGTVSASTTATTATVAGEAEKASGQVHIISHLEATEQIIEPFGTNDLTDLGNIAKTNGPDVTADVWIDRECHPYEKIAFGAGHTGVVLAPFLLAKRMANKKEEEDGGRIIPLAITLAGAGASYMMVNLTNYMHDGLGKIVSGIADLNHDEGVWSGTRTFHMEGDERQMISSESEVKKDQEAVSDFIAENIKKYPEGTVVVHFMGHGLMYRHVAGMSGTDFTRVLAQATEKAGRPIDVLVLESCLVGNMETMNALKPYARYVVASEETINAGATTAVFQKALQSSSARELTPRELATEMVRAAQGQKGIETYALIDTSQLPRLNGTLNQVASTLTAEIRDSRGGPIQQALKETPLYPKVDSGSAAMLQVGDIRSLMENLKKQYGNGGPAASSPGAGEICRQASEVIASLDSTVIKFVNTDSYKDSGGISVQLPGMTIEKARTAEMLGAKGLTPYKDAQAPAEWRTFVETMDAATAGQTKSISAGELARYFIISDGGITRMGAQ